MKLANARIDAGSPSRGIVCRLIKKGRLDINPPEVNDRASRIKQVISSMISRLSKAIME
jgi:hypothetical protein